MPANVFLLFAKQRQRELNALNNRDFDLVLHFVCAEVFEGEFSKFRTAEGSFRANLSAQEQEELGWLLESYIRINASIRRQFEND